MLLESKLMGGLLHYYMEKVSNKYCDNRSHGHIQAYLNVIILTHKLHILVCTIILSAL